MTLKEELSLSHKEAVAKQKELEAQADQEMREMISINIAPILRLMHEKYPLERDLPILVENCGTIQFTPMLELNKNEYVDHYSCKLHPTEQFLLASLRVGSEYGIDVKQHPDNDLNYIFTMTLDE